MLLELTGVRNGRPGPGWALASTRLGQALKRAGSSGRKLAVMLCDLDGFKTINDQYGHAAGDQVIIHTALRMKEAIRRSNMAARLAGDEFVALLEDLNDAEEAGIVAGKIAEMIATPITLDSAEFAVGSSNGVALYPDHGDTSKALMARADEAMYAAKVAGKRSIRFAGG